MPKKPSNVDVWLKRETPRVRKALENASRHFDEGDRLTVSTLEAVYGRESSFGTMLGARGSSKPAGHFHLKPATARRYGLSVSKRNDQRFSVDDAVSAAARYLKGLDTTFKNGLAVSEGLKAIPVMSVAERKKFVLGAYNAGEGHVVTAQHLAEQAARDPRAWSDVEDFLESAGMTEASAEEARQYVEKVPLDEIEFARKSPADKRLKQKTVKRGRRACYDEHWVTIDDHPVLICDD